MQDSNPWTFVSTEVKYKNPWMTVHEDKVVTPEGNDGIYGYIETKDSVMVTVLNDNNEVFLIHAFSYPTKSWSWELPGGGGEGQDDLTASQRELLEETGISAEQWHKLGTTRVCNGLMTERLITYLAQGVTFGDRPESDDTALIQDGQFFSFDKVHEMIQQGDIDDGQTITGLYLVEQWMARNSK